MASVAPAPGRIRIGVGGWTYPPWRRTFFPPGLPHRRELEHAARRLTTIEVNSTFYRTQTPATFARWHDEVPDDFVFAVKAPRFATSRRVLAEAGPSVERFLSSGIMALRDKLGPINWQFPPTRSFDPDDFAAFLALLPASVEGRALRHAVEVRHASFRTPAFTALLAAHGVAAVVVGDSGFPQIADPTAPFVHVRLMGTAEEHPAGYPDPVLDTWAERARIWARGALPKRLDYVGRAKKGPPRDVFLYVISGFKVRNPQAALALIERLRGPG